MNHTKCLPIITLLAALVIVAAGCQSGDEPPRRATSCCPSGDHSGHDHDAPPRPTLPQALFVSKPHPEARDLAAALSDATDGQIVTIRGSVGGRKNPFVDGWAAVLLVDPNLPNCAAHGDGNCPTPWDYCSQTGEILDANTVLVTVPGPDGAPLPVDLKGVRGIAETKELTVQGRLRHLHNGKRELQAVTIYAKP